MKTLHITKREKPGDFGGTRVIHVGQATVGYRADKIVADWRDVFTESERAWMKETIACRAAKDAEIVSITRFEVP